MIICANLLGYIMDNSAKEREQLIDKKIYATVFNVSGKRYLNECMNSKSHAHKLI